MGTEYTETTVKATELRKGDLIAFEDEQGRKSEIVSTKAGRKWLQVVAEQAGTMLQRELLIDSEVTIDRPGPDAEEKAKQKVEIAQWTVEWAARDVVRYEHEVISSLERAVESLKRTFAYGVAECAMVPEGKVDMDRVISETVRRFAEEAVRINVGYDTMQMVRHGEAYAKSVQDLRTAEAELASFASVEQ